MPINDLLLERETTLSFNDGQDVVTVWSSSPSFQRRMQKLGVSPAKTDLRAHATFSAWYRIPKSWVTIRKPTTRNLTDEQRQVMRDRARAMFKKKSDTPGARD